MANDCRMELGASVPFRLVPSVEKVAAGASTKAFRARSRATDSRAFARQRERVDLDGSRENR